MGVAMKNSTDVFCRNQANFREESILGVGGSPAKNLLAFAVNAQTAYTITQ
jgi:hypothetical protein